MASASRSWWLRDGTIVADILSAPGRDAMTWDAAGRHTKRVEVGAVRRTTRGEWWTLLVGVVRRRSSRTAWFGRRASTALRKGLPRRRAPVDGGAPFPAVIYIFVRLALRKFFFMALTIFSSLHH